ncbi:MAG: phytanoyl-CoA dioxygenase family protein, partial [Planctomycetales bacterium]
SSASLEDAFSSFQALRRPTPKRRQSQDHKTKRIMMNSQEARNLSDPEIDRYRTEGFVIPKFRLSADRVGRLREALDRVIRDNPNTRPEHLVSVHITGDTSEGVRGNDAFLELARDPDIVEMVSQVLGPDVILWGCQSFCKPGGDGMEVPWHQDGHYWPIRPLATCTAWVAIDDSVGENGCLRVIPGSHDPARVIPHLKEDRDDIALNQRVADGEFDLGAAVDVELEAGQMSLHDVYLIHGSNANRSTRRRAGLAIRYMPASSHFDREMIAPGDGVGYTVDFSTRPLWLVKGEDRAGLNDFQIGH